MVIASKPYKPGDLIAEVKPLVYSLVMREKGKRCDSCFRRPASGATLKRCSRCLKVWYCSKDCQLSDWLLHKLECPLFVKPAVPGHCFYRLDEFMPFLLRFVLLYKAKPSLFQVKHPKTLDDQFESYQDLINAPLKGHLVEVANSSIDWDIEMMEGFGIKFDENVHFLDNVAALQNQHIHTPREEIGKISDIHKHIANSLSLCSPKHVIDHSCRPSVFEEVVGRNTRLVAAREINAGERLTVSHVNLCQSKTDRQNFMKFFAGDFCHCERCETGEDLDARGLPIDYDVINRLSEQPTDKNNYQRLLTMSKGNPKLILNKIYPNEHPEKTILLISLVKAEFALKKKGKFDASLIRATIKSMQLTMPNEDVMKFDSKNDDFKTMAQYLIEFAPGQ